MIIIENGFTDTLGKIGKGIGNVAKKVNDFAYNTYDKAQRTYDYLTGESDTKYNFSKDASDSDLRKTAFNTYIKQFKDEKCKYKARIDQRAGVIQLTVNTEKVPRNFASRVMPGSTRTDSLYPFVKKFDKSTNDLILELPMDGGKSVKNQKMNKNNQKAKDQKKSTNEKESVMTPTPIPYKGYQCDKNGKLIVKESLFGDDEDETNLYFDLVRTKSVLDSDGFYTDYTWYYDSDTGEHLMIFGDRDLYTPENTEPDWSTFSETEAEEWFDHYEGFSDEDLIDESFVQDTVDLNYSNLPVEIAGRQKDVDDWEEISAKIDWTYKADKESVIQDLIEFMEEDHPEMDFDVVCDYVENNFDDVFERYQEKLLDKYYREAIDDAQENLTYDEVVDMINPIDYDSRYKDDRLDETAGLTLSTPKVAYKDKDDLEGRLEIEINGKVYKYRVNSGVDKTASEMAGTISGINKHSSGRALAYLKKNMHLVSESTSKKSSLSESVKRSDVDKVLRNLRVKLRKALLEIMMSPEFGFDRSEAEEYSGYSVKVEDGYIVVNVWAEVSYDSMWEIKNKLDPIVQTYDDSAYFDFETSGRMSAYIQADVHKGEIDESKKVKKESSPSLLDDLYQRYSLLDDLIQRYCDRYSPETHEEIWVEISENYGRAIADDVLAFLEDYGDCLSEGLTLKETRRTKIRVGDKVVHVDDSPKTSGTVVKVKDGTATVCVGDPKDKDYVDIPVDKLELEESLIKESSEGESEMKVLTLNVKDEEGSIEDLLNYIKDLAQSGHSFNVGVDDESDERHKKFWIDGDGSDKIKSIASEVKVEESSKKSYEEDAPDGYVVVDLVGDYITDHFEFDYVDEKYSCIDSIKDSFKDEKYVATEIIDQFVGAHNGRDLTEKLVEGGNPFKKHHICQGCGNPLSSCTCEVQEEDIDLENLTEGSKYKRVARYGEFDNGHVLRNDWKEMTEEEAEELAMKMSEDNPDEVFYVCYDDVMNPSSDICWVNGKAYKDSPATLHVKMRDGVKLSESVSDKDYDEFLSYQDVVANAVSSIGGDVDDYKGDLSHPYDDEDRMTIVFYSTVSKKDSKNFSRKLEGAITSAFSDTRFSRVRDVDCYKLRESQVANHVPQGLVDEFTKKFDLFEIEIKLSSDLAENESVSSKVEECTQPSNVGQHKTSSIDIIPNQSDDEEEE